MDQFQKVDLSGTDVSKIDPQLFASLAKIEKVYNGAVFESHKKGRPAFTLKFKPTLLCCSATETIFVQSH